MDQVIPLTTAPQQSFTVSLSVDDAILQLALDITFNEMAQYWTMDVTNAQGVLLLSAIPLVTGDWPAANLLAQYGYLAIGSAYIINASQAAIDYPDAISLGIDFFLVWSDTAA
jgi:hypothetical protein